MIVNLNNPFENVGRMPLQHLDLETLNGWMKANRRFKRRWEDISPAMKRRTVRTIPKWVFAMGYLAGIQAVRAELEAVPPVLETAVDKALSTVITRLEAVGKLSLIE